MNKYQPIIDHLRKLASGEIEPSVPVFGLCCEINVLTHKLCCDGIESHMELSYKSWPKWSTSVSYPVPSPFEGGEDAAEVMYYFANSDAKWRTGQYAEDRKDLCRHVANYLENLE